MPWILLQLGKETVFYVRISYKCVSKTIKYSIWISLVLFLKHQLLYGSKLKTYLFVFRRINVIKIKAIQMLPFDGLLYKITWKVHSCQGSKNLSNLICSIKLERHEIFCTLCLLQELSNYKVNKGTHKTKQSGFNHHFLRKSDFTKSGIQSLHVLA